MPTQLYGPHDVLLFSPNSLFLPVTTTIVEICLNPLVSMYDLLAFGP